MARIADDVIETLKTDISLLRLVESQGHQPTKQGNDFAGVARPGDHGDVVFYGYQAHGVDRP